MDSSPQVILRKQWWLFGEPVKKHLSLHIWYAMWPDSLGVFWSEEGIVFSEDFVFCVRDVYAHDDH